MTTPTPTHWQVEPAQGATSLWQVWLFARAENKRGYVRVARADPGRLHTSEHAAWSWAIDNLEARGVREMPAAKPMVKVA